MGARQLGHSVVHGACDAGTEVGRCPVHQKFRWWTDRGDVQLAPVHGGEDQCWIMHLRTQVGIGLHRDTGRSVEHQPISTGGAVDLHRPGEIPPAHRVDKAWRRDVEMDVDRC